MAAHPGCLPSAQDDLDKATLYAAHITLGDAKTNVGGDMFTMDRYGFHLDDYLLLKISDFLARGVCARICIAYHWGLSVTFLEASI